MVRMLVAIPCRDEAASIGSVIARIPTTVPGVDSIDVVVIDDGSTDGTAQVASAAGADVIRLPKNRGVGFAFRTALRAALDGGHDLLVTIDGDGQFSPEEIGVLIHPVLHDGAAASTGSRFVDGSRTSGIPRAKRVGNHLMSLLVSRLIGVRHRDVSCGFRCYGTEALLRLNLHGDFTYTQETFLDLAVNGMTIEEVPVTVEYFADRRSRVAASLVRYAIRTSAILLRGYRDYHPLRFFWGLGLLPLVGALAFGSVFIANYLSTGRFTGYLFAGFTAGTMLVIALALFLFGLLADVLARGRRNQERILYLLKRARYEAARAAAVPSSRSTSHAGQGGI